MVIRCHMLKCILVLLHGSVTISCSALCFCTAYMRAFHLVRDLFVAVFLAMAFSFVRFVAATFSPTRCSSPSFFCCTIFSKMVLTFSCEVFYVFIVLVIIFTLGILNLPRENTQPFFLLELSLLVFTFGIMNLPRENTQPFCFLFSFY